MKNCQILDEGGTEFGAEIGGKIGGKIGGRFGRTFWFDVSSWIFDGLKKELGAQIRTDGRESQTEQAHQL